MVAPSHTYRFVKDCSIDGLYKFRPYETDVDVQRAKDLLKGRLYFAKPPQLNDPFEMRNRLVLDENKKRRRKAATNTANRLLRETGAGSPAKRLELASRFAYQLEGRAGAIERAERNHHERMDERCVVYSMCATRAHPLLWSHYASKHTGLCVQFDHTKVPLAGANEVNYSAGYPVVTYPFDKNKLDELAVKAILTKAEYWTYEKEFRLWSVRMGNEGWHLGLDWDDDLQTAHVDPRLIVGVTLGARMRPEQHDDIANYCRSTCPHVQIEQARTCPDRYELEFLPMLA